MNGRIATAIGAATVLAVAASVVMWVDRDGGGKPPPPQAAATSSATPSTTAPAAPVTTDAPPATTAPPTTLAPTAPPTTTPPKTPTTQPMTEPTAVPAARPAKVCAGAGGGEPAAAPFPGDDPRAGRKWVTVGHLTGRCDGASPLFHLRGVDTRLLFRGSNGSLVVFLVDAKQGLDASAGYADAECEGPCSDSQVLVDQAGDYLLQVHADDGPWEVAVQEYRAP